MPSSPSESDMMTFVLYMTVMVSIELSRHAIEFVAFWSAGIDARYRRDQIRFRTMPRLVRLKRSDSKCDCFEVWCGDYCAQPKMNTVSSIRNCIRRGDGIYARAVERCWTPRAKQTGLTRAIAMELESLLVPNGQNVLKVNTTTNQFIPSTSNSH